MDVIDKRALLAALGFEGKRVTKLVLTIDRERCDLEVTFLATTDLGLLIGEHVKRYDLTEKVDAA